MPAIIATIDLALSVLEHFAPQINQLVSNGEITTAKQQEILNRIALIESGAAFNQPHWKPESE